MSGKKAVAELMRAFNERDWEATARLLSDQLEFRDPADDRVIRSPQEFVSWLQEGLIPFPDATADDVRLIEEGSTVISLLVERATHGGPLSGPDGTIAATGCEMSWPLCNVWELGADGRITGGETYYDPAMPIRQIEAATTQPKGTR